MAKGCMYICLMIMIDTALIIGEHCLLIPSGIFQGKKKVVCMKYVNADTAFLLGGAVLLFYTAWCSGLGVLLEYPTTIGFQWGYLKNDPFTYTVSGGNGRILKLSCGL